MIDVPDNVSIVAGPEPRRDAYKNSKRIIDIDCMNIIGFPVHFAFEESMKCCESAIQAFDKYIADKE